ncbi:MAG: hypothetical protein K2V38_06785, partial [Gemmataceae bacterium]|nr:hypothetical protein [Gemmataceae bacterium]
MMTDALLILCALLLIAAVVMLALLLLRRPAPPDFSDTTARLQSLADLQARAERAVGEQLTASRREHAEAA